MDEVELPDQPPIDDELPPPPALHNSAVSRFNKILKQRTQPSFHEECNWVVANLYHTHPASILCPSIKAWNLLRTARKKPLWFWQHILKQMEVDKNKKESPLAETEEMREEQRTVEELKVQLVQWVKESQSE